jgi:DNA-binding protein YbaB
MSTALPDKALTADRKFATDDRRIVSADRLIDHYHQLICTAGDARDVETFIVRYLRRLRVTDAAVLRFLGLSALPPAPEGDPPPLFGGGGGGEALPEGLRAAVTPFVAQALERRARLEAATESLRRLHQPAQLKLLGEADTALRNGMRATDRDRLEDFRDALRLLRAVQSDPVSGRDYQVWFNVGWILWQMEGDFAEAEEAFYQASRLSASAGDILHVLSLRHQAYMQYLQNKHKQAHATISKAVALAQDDPETLFDAARYAAKAERDAEGAAHLEAALNHDPLYLMFALTEEDFQSDHFLPRVKALAESRQARAGEALEAEVGRWLRALSAAKEAAEQSGVTIALPGHLTDSGFGGDVAHTAKADFFTVQSASVALHEKANAVRAAAASALETALADVEAELDKAERQFDKLKKDWEQWRNTMKWLEKEAREAGFSLEPGGPMETVRLRMQKKLDRVRDARNSYVQSKENLEHAVKALKDNGPALEKTVNEVRERRDKVAAARDWLLAQDL